jgi:hypothetical protein
MKRNLWGGLGLGLVVCAVLAPSAATPSDPFDAPWPPLLSGEPAADPEFAALHTRANAALDALLRRQHAAYDW